ncbi:hypothetical protein CRUP_036354 [Coryphaenoides rupestris]|nr:hypothetical protein CRUP_036354 [Coryphaenoides rupestris]
MQGTDQLFDAPQTLLGEGHFVGSHPDLQRVHQAPGITAGRTSLRSRWQGEVKLWADVIQGLHLSFHCSGFIRDETADLREKLADFKRQIQQVMEDMCLALSEQKEMQQQQEQLIQNYHKTQLEQLQEETFRLEAAKDDYSIRCEELVQELAEARSQNEELTSLADEAQSLKDEMEVLRHSTDNVSKLKRKKDHESMQDMNRLLKQREELNSKSDEIQSLHGSLTEALVSKEQVKQRVLQVLDVTQHSIPEEVPQTNREEVQVSREEVQRTSREEVQRTSREEVQMSRKEVQYKMYLLQSCLENNQNWLFEEGTPRRTERHPTKRGGSRPRGQVHPKPRRRRGPTGRAPSWEMRLGPDGGRQPHQEPAGRPDPGAPKRRRGPSKR